MDECNTIWAIQSYLWATCHDRANKPTELINIISKNGGTLDLGFLIFIAIFISLFTAAIYDVSIEENNKSTSNNQTEEKDTTTFNSNNNNIDSNDTNIFKDIIVELPSSYKEKAIINKERKIIQRITTIGLFSFFIIYIL